MKKRAIILTMLLSSSLLMAQQTYRDNFGSVSYANNDGTHNWSGNWIESGDTNLGPSAQYIYINNNQLEFYYLFSENIRRTADLSTATSAILSFNWQTIGLSGGQSLAIQISTNQTTGFVTLQTFSGTTSAGFSQDISAYISGNTTIRFIKSGINWGSSDFARVDNVLISATTVSAVDTDNDGIDDTLDLDSDNDGIPDLQEGDCIPILNNASIESPLINGSTPFLESHDGGNIKLYHESNVPYWETTASDGAIEMWLSSNTLSIPHANAHSGNQFMELNANEVASSFQDIATVPGTTIQWSIAHRGRDGVDVATVSLGPPGSLSVVETMSSGNTAWVVYTGTYAVPAGQTVTRFQFDSVSSASGLSSVGNFIDTFTVECISAVDSDSDGVPDYLDLDSDNDGIYDLIEGGPLDVAGVDDVDSDGRIDTGTGSFGANGLYNILENNDTTSATITYTVLDSDADGSRDFRELDSDNDGCTDVVEAGYTDANDDGLLASLPVTVDGDGLVTGTGTVDGYTLPRDGDSNGTYDFREYTPLLVSHPTSQALFSRNTAVFNVVASGIGLMYQWQISTDGGLSFTDLSDTAPYSGTSTDELTITNISLDMDGHRFRVHVINDAYLCHPGIPTNAALLNVSIGTMITNRRITYRTKRN